MDGSFDLCSKKKSSEEEMTKQLAPASFKKDVENITLLWVVDPGVTNIFTALNSSSNDKSGRVIAIFTKGHYHLCGFNQAAEEFHYKRQLVVKVRFRNIHI